ERRGRGEDRGRRAARRATLAVGRGVRALRALGRRRAADHRRRGNVLLRGRARRQAALRARARRGGLTVALPTVAVWGGAAADLPRASGVRAREVAAAYRECVRIARTHYENFTVGSFLLPRPLRRHVAALYAFARAADDMA